MVLSALNGSRKANATYGKRGRKVLGTAKQTMLDSDSEESQDEKEDDAKIVTLKAANIQDSKTSFDAVVITAAAAVSSRPSSRVVAKPSLHHPKQPSKTTLQPSSPLSSPPPLSSSGSKANRMPASLALEEDEKLAARPSSSSGSDTRGSSSRKAGLAARARTQDILSSDRETDIAFFKHRRKPDSSSSKAVSTAAPKSPSDSSLDQQLSSLSLSPSRPEHSIEEEDSEADDPAVGALLNECGQSISCSFDEAMDGLLSKGAAIGKAGEASYSEVYRLRDRKGRSSILKVVPLTVENSEKAPRKNNKAVDVERNGISLSSPDDVQREIAIIKSLAELNETTSTTGGRFVQLISSTVVRGPYSDKLLDAWDAHHQQHAEESENLRPACSQDDYHCLLHLSDGGSDLESVQLSSWTQALSIFAQIVNLLAMAEASRQFEHRDLHWGNVLVETPSPHDSNESLPSLSWSDLLYESGIKTTIIDFTLSRLRTSDTTLFHDLKKDPSLFTGDADVDHQFEVYRQMRERIQRLGEQEDWSTFEPATNVLWCLYLLRKLLYEKDLPKVSCSGRSNGGKGQQSKRVDRMESKAFERLRSLEAILAERIERAEGAASDETYALDSAVALEEYLKMEWD